MPEPGVKFQANIKAGNDLHNVYGETAEELEQNCAKFPSATVAALSAELNGLYTAARTLGAAPAAQQPAVQQYATPVAQAVTSAQAATPAAATPTGDAQYCEHGPREYKEGTSKAGKPYKAWFCSSPDRDYQCAPKWVK